MPSAVIIDLEPATLLVDSLDRSVLSFRHRCFGATAHGVVPLERAATQIMNCVVVGVLDPAKPGVLPSIPTCSRCGCTDDFACEHGCAWSNVERTICTSCAEGKS